MIQIGIVTPDNTIQLRNVLEGVNRFIAATDGIALNLILINEAIPGSARFLNRMDRIFYIYSHKNDPLPDCGKPAVIIDPYHVIDQPEYPHFIPDYSAAAELAAHTVCKQGYRNILFLKGGKRNAQHDSVWIQQLEKTAALYGAKTDSRQRLPLKTEPESVFITSNILRAAELLQSSNREIAVFNARHEPLYSPLCPVPVTALDQSLDALGYLAMQSLLKNEPHKNTVKVAPRGLIPGETLPPKKNTDHPMDSVFSLIKNNCCLTVDEIAGQLNISTRTLERHFSAQTGQTLKSCITAERMEQAKTRLAHSGLPFDSISVSAGFSNVSNFNRAFTVYTGIPPARWRRIYAPT